MYDIAVNHNSFVSAGEISLVDFANTIIGNTTHSIVWYLVCEFLITVVINSVESKTVYKIFVVTL